MSNLKNSRSTAPVFFSRFEQIALEQNRRHEQRRADARASAAPCYVVPMLAFGGVDYCTTHGVMGACPFGGAR